MKPPCPLCHYWLPTHSRPIACHTHTPCRPRSQPDPRLVLCSLTRSDIIYKPANTPSRNLHETPMSPSTHMLHREATARARDIHKNRAVWFWCMKWAQSMPRHPVWSVSKRGRPRRGLFLGYKPRVSLSDYPCPPMLTMFPRALARHTRQSDTL